MNRFALFAFLSVASFTTRDVAGADKDVFTQKPEVVAVEINGAPKTPKKTATAKTSSKKLNLQSGPKAGWIWGTKRAAANDRFYFRKTFKTTTETTAARIIASCDNHLALWINGKRLLASDDWNAPVTADIQQHLLPGENLIEVEGRNAGGPAGLAVKLVFRDTAGKTTTIVSNKTWRVATTRDSKTASAATVLGTMGVSPWCPGPWRWPWSWSRVWWRPATSCR